MNCHLVSGLSHCSFSLPSYSDLRLPLPLRSAVVTPAPGGWAGVAGWPKRGLLGPQGEKLLKDPHSVGRGVTEWQEPSVPVRDPGPTHVNRPHLPSREPNLLSCLPPTFPGCCSQWLPLAQASCAVGSLLPNPPSFPLSFGEWGADQSPSLKASPVYFHRLSPLSFVDVSLVSLLHVSFHLGVCFWKDPNWHRPPGVSQGLPVEAAQGTCRGSFALALPKSPSPLVQNKKMPQPIQNLTKNITLGVLQTRQVTSKRTVWNISTDLF